MYTRKVPVRLRIGDELRKPGLPTHVMTYVGPLGPRGEDILDAPKNGAAQLVPSTAVLSRGPVFLGQRGPQSPVEQQVVRQRALQVLGTPNKSLGPNCEHISSFVRTGATASPQLRGAAVLSILGVILWFLGNSSTSRAHS